MFTLTPAAARQILDAAARGDAAGLALRVAARQEADGSIAYGMGFDAVVDDDRPRQLEGVTVVIAPGSQPLLDATVLDFVELEPGAFSFIFIPPREAASGCGAGGCGTCSPGGCA
jgi:iron-sulfur cluster assembly protein